MRVAVGVGAAVAVGVAVGVRVGVGSSVPVPELVLGDVVVVEVEDEVEVEVVRPPWYVVGDPVVDVVGELDKVAVADEAEGGALEAPATVVPDTSRAATLRTASAPRRRVVVERTTLRRRPIR